MTRFASDQAAGATLGVVYGRLRQGKTFLLDALCRGSGGFYFAATEATETDSLALFGAELSTYLGLSTPLNFENWYQAIDQVLALGKDQITPVVIDEFPYLVRATPSLPSIIQRAYPPLRDERVNSRVRLLLCGSAISFMGNLLTGSAPLRGRAGLEMVVPTLDYRLAAEFWQLNDPRLAILLNSVVGGTPAYRNEFAHGDTPENIDDFDSWIIRNVLDRDSPLFREARHLLAEEPNMRDAGIYHSVLGAIASGNNTRSGIASFMGRKVSDLTHPLTVLEDSGLIIRQADIFRPARTTYTIAEPLVTFYHAIMRPEWSRLDRIGQAERIWSNSQDRFVSKVVGPHFESLCREWTQFFSEPGLFSAPPSVVGRGVVNDAGARKSHEVDVAVIGSSHGNKRPLLAIGEAKWGEQIGFGHLNRLQRIHEILKGKTDIDSSTTKLMLFSGTGFSRELTAAAKQDDSIVLVDLEMLYGN